MAADGSHTFSCESKMSWLRLKGWPMRKGVVVQKSLAIVDLFSGCGGMTLGTWEAARQLGRELDIRLAVDLDPRASAVYCDNFKLDARRMVCADVRDVISGAPGTHFSAELMALKSAVGEVDVLLAGPPCQGHSDLNNHSRRYDPRNDLYMCAVRGVELFSPTFVVIENVPTIVHDWDNVVEKAARYLELIGYRVAQLVVEIEKFGVAQRRRRHVTLASRCLSKQELFGLAKSCGAGIPVLKDAIYDLQDEADVRLGAFYSSTRLSRQNVERIRWLFEMNAYNLPNALRPPCHRDKAHSYRSMYGRLGWDLPAQTLTSGFGSMGQGRYVHPSRQRMLTCHEAARLQGFPDFFSFSSCNSLTSLREMIGNAVPPQFVAAVVKAGFGMPNS